MHSHDDDIRIGPDGSQTTVPRKIVETDETLRSSHSGGICVHSGVFTIGPSASHSGSLQVEPGAQVIISGSHTGSLHVAGEATVTVRGKQSGSVHVAKGGRVIVKRGGRLAGSLHVSGVIENMGTRGGSEHIDGGDVVDLLGGTVKRPTRTIGGAAVYEW
ncbi:hypothetical protein [Microbacterium sp. K24]|jgi:hypothetical protein|uniref:hypothetical protein n=1 Tax=Microbacterium sp. K24 TaxID=2305446 RepID=UPI00109D19B4|nr:hypothetical protein [Microbacterium sp. K24]